MTLVTQTSLSVGCLGWQKWRSDSLISDYKIGYVDDKNQAPNVFSTNDGHPEFPHTALALFNFRLNQRKLHRRTNRTVFGILVWIGLEAVHLPTPISWQTWPTMALSVPQLSQHRVEWWSWEVWNACSLPCIRELYLLYAWNPNGAPCFAWKGSCFGGLTFKNRGHLGSICTCRHIITYQIIQLRTIKPSSEEPPLNFLHV